MDRGLFFKQFSRTADDTGDLCEASLEVAAQIAQSNEHLKRIADALEQLVHRGVPAETPWSALADYEIVHVDGDRRNNEASNLRLVKRPEVPK